MGGVDRKNQTGRPLGARLLRVCLACWNFNPGNFQLHPPSPAPTQHLRASVPTGECQLLCSVPRRSCGGPPLPAGMLPLFPPRLGAGTVAEAGGGAGPLVSRFRVVLFPLGSLENVRKGGVDVHPCALPGSPSGSAVFSLEKALPVVSGERALGSVAKGGAQGSRAFTLQTLPSNCA